MKVLIFERCDGRHIGGAHMGHQAFQPPLTQALLGGSNQLLRRAAAAELRVSVEKTEEAVAFGQLQSQLGVVHLANRAALDIELSHHRLATQQGMQAGTALKQPFRSGARLPP